MMLHHSVKLNIRKKQSIEGIRTKALLEKEHIRTQTSVPQETEDQDIQNMMIHPPVELSLNVERKLQSIEGTRMKVLQEEEHTRTQTSVHPETGDQEIQ